jgi:hypothetical protein
MSTDKKKSSKGSPTGSQEPPLISGEEKVLERAGSTVLKVDNVVKVFDGTVPFHEWWMKFKLLSRFQNWSEREQLEFLVLRLEGRALSLYLGMDEDDQMDLGLVVQKLKAAYTANPDEAVRLLMARKFVTGESPEVLYSELANYVKLSAAGEAIDAQLLFQLVKPHFMRVMPDSIRSQLKLSRPTSADSLVSNARLLLSELVDDQLPSGPVGAVKGRGKQTRSAGKFLRKVRKLSCFRCGAKDHVATECSYPNSVCFVCKKEGHISADCAQKTTGKNVVGGLVVGGVVGGVKVGRTTYPTMETTVLSPNGNASVSAVAGIDTFSCASLIDESLVKRLNIKVQPASQQLVSLTGSALKVVGSAWVNLVVDKRQLRVRLSVMSGMSVCKLLLGLDVHHLLGKQLVVDNVSGSAKYVVGAVAVKDVESKWVVEEEDFKAWAESVQGSGAQRFKWFFEWKWVHGSSEEARKNRQTSCTIYNKPWFDETTGAKFDREVKKWIDEGVLIPEPASAGADFQILPWNLVDQPNKPSTPLRLTLDYGPLNAFIKGVTQESLNEVCLVETRKWRCQGDAGGVLLDISRAYLQVHLAPSLHGFQRTMYAGKVYRLTRLGFGITIGPKVLCAILRCILKDFLSRGVLGLYRDDMLVFGGAEEIAKQVRERLAEHGFQLKESSPLPGSRILGLQLETDNDGVLCWKRAEVLDPAEVDSLRTIRDVAKYLGRIAAKYPVLDWLRVVAAKGRSLVGSEASARDWDSEMSPELKFLLETHIRDRLRTEGDPARGRWLLNPDKGFTLYCDASLTAEAAVLCSGIDNDKFAVEDVVALVKNPLHANVHELNAVLLGLKLFQEYFGVIESMVKDKVVLRVLTDSSCVLGWLKLVLADRVLPKSKSMFWCLVQRRLEAIRHVFSDLKNKVDFSVNHIPGNLNPADRLTRVEELSSATIGAVVGVFGRNAPDQARALFEKFWRVLQNPPKVLASEAHRVASVWHEEMGHSSTKLAMDTLKRWFELEDERGFRKQLDLISDLCTVCSVKRARPKAAPPSGPVTTASQFNQEVFCDFLKLSGREVPNGIVVLVDAYSRYLQVTPVVGAVNSSCVIRALSDWRAEFGSPKILRADRGLENCNQFVAAYCEGNGIRVQFGSVGHPQSQSLVERVHRSLLLLIRSLKEQNHQMSLSDRVVEARRIYLRRVHSRLGMSPLERRETAGIPEGNDSSGDEGVFDTSDEEDLRFNPGDPVMWKKVSSSKDEFGLIKGKIVKKLPRGAYVFSDGVRERERIVNQDRLVRLPSNDASAANNESSESESECEISESVVPEIRRSQRTRRAPARYRENDD